MSNILAHWHLVVGIIIGIYGVLIRLIPTIGNYTLLSIIVKLLTWLDENVQVRKKK